jgi:hypothetical protein
MIRFLIGLLVAKWLHLTFKPLVANLNRLLIFRQGNACEPSIILVEWAIWILFETNFQYGQTYSIEAEGDIGTPTT